MSGPDRVRPVEARRSGDVGVWRPAFEAGHQNAVLAILLALLAFSVLGVGVGPGSGLLLLGGALIGVPHGVSDFLVAHRLWRRSLGPAWLPAFVVGYLGVIGLVMLGWRVLPLPTLVLFLLVSGLHFGAGEGLAPARSQLTSIARALTPTLPIFMFHPGEVGRALSLMTVVPEADAVHWLVGLTRFAVWPWMGLVAYGAAESLSGRHGSRASDGIELLTLAAAAWLLPPFLTFAIYFCLLHAVRHMTGIAAAVHPLQPGRALALAVTIILPCACLCLAALAMLWERLAGSVRADDLIAPALQLLAALTVPHMALEALGQRATGMAGARNGTSGALRDA